MADASRMQALRDVERALVELLKRNPARHWPAGLPLEPDDDHFDAGWIAAVRAAVVALRSLQTDALRVVLPPADPALMGTEYKADTIFCFTEGVKVPIAKCIDNCGAPELRPACWAARGIAHSFDVDSPDEPDPTVLLAQ